MNEPRLWFLWKNVILGYNSVLTLNVESILEENVQSDISLSRVIDVNTCLLEYKITSNNFFILAIKKNLYKK